MIVAIHQPNFFPWLGYFRKIAKADLFIFLDNVQFPRTSKGTWINRVKVLIGGEGRWITCPIRRNESIQSIKQVHIADEPRWRSKLLHTLKTNYGRAPYFDEVFEFIEIQILNPSDLLANYNINFIKNLSNYIDLHKEFILASTVKEAYNYTCSNDEQMKGSALLSDLCTAVGGGVYLAGDGAGGYEDPSVYLRAGIELRKSGFVCKPYPQIGNSSFVPGMSVLDALFNIGRDGVRQLLLNDCK